MSTDKHALGPVEGFDWPKRLRASVVDAAGAPRIHGYDVDRDLARHYGFSDVVYLAATGRLPSDVEGAALDAILVFASPISVAEAPSHGAGLVRMCGGTAGAVIGAAGIGLGEWARYSLRDFDALVAWLEGPGNDAPPEAYRSTTPADDARVTALALELEKRGHLLPARVGGLSILGAIACALAGIGLKRTEQAALVLALARLPAAAAEAYAVKPGDFRAYPMRLPDFSYEGGEQ